MHTETSKTKVKPRTEPAIKHELNNIVVEQRVTDGFINGTTMCVAHGKRIKEWFSNQSTLQLIQTLAEDLEMQIKGGNYPLSGAAGVSAAFPGLIVSKRGSPENGGGVRSIPTAIATASKMMWWCRDSSKMRSQQLTVATSSKMRRW